ncbi:hypothetical protein KUCAC02_007013 [Chaenocephalus aceratus]|nr:hypothetical protein KUCAC02_007013 [Chaenocephalus aceratus]
MYGKVFMQNYEVFFDDKTSKQILEYFTKEKSPATSRTQPFLEPQIKAKIEHAKKEKGVRRFYEISMILIDPGHGGKDSGAIGRHGDKVIKEKEVTLAVGLELESLLRKKYPHKTILLTRKDDVYKRLEERVDMSRKNLKLGQAEVYVSIHANATLTNPKTAKGFEVWYLPAAFERKMIDHVQIKNPNLRTVLDKVVQEEYLAESERLAKFLMSSMDKGIGHLTKHRGIRRGEWFVVRHAQMAAVLVELGFLTHPEEFKRLGNRIYLKNLARFLYNGIVEFTEYFEQQQ